MGNGKQTEGKLAWPLHVLAVVCIIPILEILCTGTMIGFRILGHGDNLTSHDNFRACSSS